MIDQMCVAAVLPVQGFGVSVPHGGQSLLRCPCFQHLKHLPSFINRVLSSVVSLSISIALGSRCLGKEKVFLGVSFFVSIGFPPIAMEGVCLVVPLLQGDRWFLAKKYGPLEPKG